MALRKKGKYRYGDSHLDIETELSRYSDLNGYPTKYYVNASCICSGKLFNLKLDDNEGVAIRSCVSCEYEHPIGDSIEYTGNAELEECECPCGFAAFEITVGISLFEESEDIKWIYIGCRCENCGLTACYGDWKNEYSNFYKLISRI
jgi:hypothetical protein